MRTLRDDRRLGPFATVWLVDMLALDTDEIQAADVEAQVALLHAVPELRGPHVLAAWLPLMLGVRSDVGKPVIETAVRARTSQGGEVLDAIAASHADRMIGKAARKALFKLRSAGS